MQKLLSNNNIQTYPQPNRYQENKQSYAFGSINPLKESNYQSTSKLVQLRQPQKSNLSKALHRCESFMQPAIPQIKSVQVTNPEHDEQPAPKFKMTTKHCQTQFYIPSRNSDQNSLTVYVNISIILFIIFIVVALLPDNIFMEIVWKIFDLVFYGFGVGVGILEIAWEYLV